MISAESSWPRVLLLLVMLCTGGCASPVSFDESKLELRLQAIADEIAPRELAVEFRYLWGTDHASVNADVVMHAASTMKLAVLLTLMREDMSGGLSIDSNLPVVNRFRSVADGSEFKLDPADDGETDLYLHVGTSTAVRELARRMITKSSNLATNILMERLTPALVQGIVASVGATDTRIVRGVQDLKAFDAGLVNVTTAHDLALILEAIFRDVVYGPDVKVAWPMQLLRDQEFNDMIPAGLPSGTAVLHKTGQIARIHHDAAIVMLPTPSLLHFEFPAVLVVMTRGFEDPEQSAALGALVARTVHEFLLAQ
ncbi:MAG: serine hydrolase [Planctomycetota bacterium]|nr:serine hydrolase [Planctomycetota bacterium]